MTALEGVVITGTAQRAAWVEKRMPPVEELPGGVWSIPVPIPGNPLRYVLVYVLESDRGLSIVDAGWESSESWAALVDGLRVMGAAPSDISRVLVTHMHPDHYGLVERIRAESGAEVVMHPADAARLPGPSGTVSDMLADLAAFLRRCGMPEPEIQTQVAYSDGVIPFRTGTPPDRLVEDGDIIVCDDVRLRAVWTPGHTPGHVCFFDEKRAILLAGDHVLPRISPNVSLYTTAPLDPLADYLESLEKVCGLGVREVFPAHEYRFTGLAARAATLRRHHEARLEEILALLDRDDLTCWEVAERLTWSRPWDQIRGYMRQAAVGETMAHLRLLQVQGEIGNDAGLPQRWARLEVVRPSPGAPETGRPGRELGWRS